MYLHFKAYWISIVWRCYKYLTLRQQNARSTVHYILRGDETERIPDPEFLLPDYEAACASFKQPPPPSYQAAMEGQPPAYPETIHVTNISQDNIPTYGFVITHVEREGDNNLTNNNCACGNEENASSSVGKSESSDDRVHLESNVMEKASSSNSNFRNECNMEHMKIGDGNRDADIKTPVEEPLKL